MASISEGMSMVTRASGSLVVAGAAAGAEIAEGASLLGLAGAGAVEATVVVGLGEAAGAAEPGLGVEDEGVGVATDVPGALVVVTKGVELTTGLAAATAVAAFGAVAAAVVVGLDAMGVATVLAAGLTEEAPVWDAVAAVVAALLPFEAALND